MKLVSAIASAVLIVAFWKEHMHVHAIVLLTVSIYTHVITTRKPKA